MGCATAVGFRGCCDAITVKHVIQNSPCPVMVLRSGMTILDKRQPDDSSAKKQTAASPDVFKLNSASDSLS